MKTKWRLMFVIALAGWTLTSLATEPAKPNFVLILADDLGWADVPWHGSPYKMPVLDRLAKEGVRLEAHYSIAAQDLGWICKDLGKVAWRGIAQELQ